MLGFHIKVRGVFVTLPKDSIVANKSYVLLRKKNIKHSSYYLLCIPDSSFILKPLKSLPIRTKCCN